jgi:hypothetical protein
MTFAPNYFASKRWKKLGVENCAQLLINKKTTPDHAHPQLFDIICEFPLKSFTICCFAVSSFWLVQVH